VITLLAQSGGHAVRTASTRVRFGNAGVAYVRYLGKAFWPVRLAVLYPHLGRFLPNWEIAASAVVLILLTALVVRWRSHRYLVVGWFWFLGTLVPVIGIFQVGVQSMADRYAYLHPVAAQDVIGLDTNVLQQRYLFQKQVGERPRSGHRRTRKVIAGSLSEN
jgi:protein O-mannosyl-transferase